MTVTEPVGCRRTIDDSQPPAPTPIALVTADGARPQISTQRREPDAAVVAARRGLRPALREARIVGHLERRVERGP